MNFKAQLCTKKSLYLLLSGMCLGVGATLAITLLLPLHTPASFEHTNSVAGGGWELVLLNSPDLNVQSSQNVDASTITSVVNQIEDLLVLDHSFERLAALYKVVSQLDNHTLKELLSHSTDLNWSISDHGKSELQTVLIERLVTINLGDAIEFVLNQEYGNQDTTPSLISIIVDASNPDLESAATGFIPVAEVSRTLAYRLISKNHSYIPFKRKREIATQLDLETNFIRLYLKSLGVATLKDTQQVRRTGIDDPSQAFSYVSQLVGNLKQWYRNRGIDVLHRMRSTLQNDDVEEIIESIVLTHFALEKPALMFEYVLTELSTETQPLAAEEVIREWATQDPSGAFAAVNDLEAGRVKKELQYSVVYYWATKDPLYVLENLSSFPPHTQVDGASNAIGSLATDSPNRAVAWIAQMSDVNMLRAASNTLLSVWSRTDLNAVQKWVLEEPAIAGIRTDLYEPLAYRMVAKDPLGALALARKHPLATGQVGIEASIFREIAFQDIQAALELLPKVRAEQKNFAYGAVGSVYVQNSDFQKAVDLGLQLNESAHASYYQYISYIWVNTNANSLYEMLPDLPNEKARSKAAYALCVLNDDNDYFTKAQAEVLDQYLTTEDRATLGPLAPSNDS